MLFERLRNDCGQDWTDYTQHEFVRRLGDGSLEEASFRHYLQQDYLFLIHFARAYSLAGFKARNLADLRRAKAGLSAILDAEIGLHIDYCKGWGITATDLEKIPEARATMAYTRYVLERGAAGSLLDLHVALAPCMQGYGEIAEWLLQQDWLKHDDNPYMPWIETYSAREYQDIILDARAYLNDLGQEISPTRYDELLKTFREATRLETGFWDMGLNLEP